MAGIVRQVVRYQQPVPAPCVLLSGGETTGLRWRRGIIDLQAVMVHVSPLRCNEPVRCSAELTRPLVGLDSRGAIVMRIKVSRNQRARRLVTLRRCHRPGGPLRLASHCYERRYRDELSKSDPLTKPRQMREPTLDLP